MANTTNNNHAQARAQTILPPHAALRNFKPRSSRRFCVFSRDFNADC